MGSHGVGITLRCGIGRWYEFRMYERERVKVRKRDKGIEKLRIHGAMYLR